MLGFVIPIKPRKHSRNWEMDNDLLNRTLQSICGQTSKSFQVIIVYTDLPDIKLSGVHIHAIQYPYGDISIEQITDWEDRSKWYAPEYAERMMDKSRKIMMGCGFAKELGCTYLMAVDSDDLVSNKLAGFVFENGKTRCAGWRITHGYLYEEGSKIILKNKKIWGMNGSTHIVRVDLVKVPDLETNYNLFDYSLFEGHAYAMQRLIDHYNETLLYLPFYGVVYTIHTNNHSRVKEIVSAKTLTQLLKKIVRGKLVTNAIRQEFGLYNIG